MRPGVHFQSAGLERGDYLCELAVGWQRELPTAANAPVPQLRETTDGEVDARFAEHCDPQELATRMKQSVELDPSPRQ
jgi:hypothetical protein